MTLSPLGVAGCPRVSRGTGARGAVPGGRQPVTFVAVEGVGGQAQGGGADTAAETLSVEEVALGTQPLHHVHALLAEVTGVAAAQVQGKGLPCRFLGGTGHQREEQGVRSCGMRGPGC